MPYETRDVDEPTVLTELDIPANMLAWAQGYAETSGQSVSSLVADCIWYRKKALEEAQAEYDSNPELQRVLAEAAKSTYVTRPRRPNRHVAE